MYCRRHDYTRALEPRVDRGSVGAAGFLIAAAGFAGLTRLHAHSPIWSARDDDPRALQAIGFTF